MRDDFCAFVLTHGRPGNVVTLATLRNSGYSGKVFLVIDDQDPSGQEYRERYGDAVLEFSKPDVAETFDEMDNFGDRRSVVYARNACFDLAAQVGCRYFIQLDDDYTRFQFRTTGRGSYGYSAIKDIDPVFEALVDFYRATPIATIAMSQGGDHLGGSGCSDARTIKLRRKAMNSFVCSTDRPFLFPGRINEDVNAYTVLASRGAIFLTTYLVMLTQKQTQASAGGMTDLYLESGTYLKSFYSVLGHPSGVKVASLHDSASDRAARLHHRVEFRNVAPRIVREHLRKPAKWLSSPNRSATKLSSL